MNVNDKNRSTKIEDTEIFISKVLKLGVIISASTIGLGLIMFSITKKSGYPGSTFPTSSVQIIKGLILFIVPLAIVGARLYYVSQIVHNSNICIPLYQENDFLQYLQAKLYNPPNYITQYATCHLYI